MLAILEENISRPKSLLRSFDKIYSIFAALVCFVINDGWNAKTYSPVIWKSYGSVAIFSQYTNKS